MTALTKTLRRIGSGVILAGLFAAAAHGQEEETSSADAFNIPEDISILNQSDSSVRRASAKVNGTIITGTDVDQRVALIVAANEDVVPSPEELQRLRLQVFRNLIDETLQIQEAQAQEIAVETAEVDETYARLAAERFNRTVEEQDVYLRSIGSSPGSLKRQIEGEMSWDRLLRRNVAPYVNVSTSEVNELFERMQNSVGTEEYRIGEIYLSATPTTRQAVAENWRA